jgi:hypothetical protein
LLLFGTIALVLCLLRDARSRALALAVLLFPFLLALSPATWFWGDGRYANLGFPLIALVLLVGSAEVARRAIRGRGRNRQQALVRRLVMSGAALVLLLVTVANFANFSTPNTSFLAGWTNPNEASLQTATNLEAVGIQYGYADYWVAYKLDFLSGGRLQITTAGNDVDRWQAQHAVVRQAKSQAWLFTTPTGEAAAQFGATVSIQGPNGMSQSQFLADLARLGVGYRTINAGLVQAVIPDRRVTPAEVGQTTMV